MYQQALLLYQQLSQAKERLLAGASWKQIQSDTAAAFATTPTCKLEYFALLHPEKFEIFDTFTQEDARSLCIAAYVGPVRLIDNLPIIA